MKRKKLSARSIVAWIIGIYAAIIFLVNLPFMQSFMADRMESMLSSVLDTKVEVGSVNVGFLNRIIINDISIQDQKQRQMLKVARVSASVSIWSLINGKIDIPTAQLYGTRAILYKETPDSTPNYQFIIDALSSDDDEEPAPLDIKINSFIVRKANIAYDIKSLPIKRGTIDANHIHLTNAGFNLSLKHLTDDSLSMTLKRMAGKEEISGLQLKELAMSVEANKQKATINNLAIKLLNSEVNIDTLRASYPKYESEKKFSVGQTTINATITPSDLTCIVPELRYATTPLHLTLDASGSESEVKVSALNINSDDKQLIVALNGDISSFDKKIPDANIDIQQIMITSAMTSRMADEYPILKEALEHVAKAGDISYHGIITSHNSEINSDGEINTSLGKVNYIATLDQNCQLDAHLSGEGIALASILENEKFGAATFTLDANTNIDGLIHGHEVSIPEGMLNAQITELTYNNHTYSNLTLEAQTDGNNIDAKAYIDDEYLSFNIDAIVEDAIKDIKGLRLDCCIKNFNAEALGIKEQLGVSSLSCMARANIRGNNLDNLSGAIDIHDLAINANKNTYNVEAIQLTINQEQEHKQLRLNADCAEASVKGRFRITELAANFQNIVAQHLPALVRPVPTTYDTDITYDVTLNDAPVIHHFITADYAIGQPLHINGTLNSSEHLSRLSLDVQDLTYDGHNLNNVQLNCNSTRNNMMFNLTGQENNINDGSHTSVSLIGIARNNKIDFDIQLNNTATNTMNLKMFATTNFADSLGHIKTKMNIAPSTLVINDTTWNISHSNLSIYNKEIACSNFKLSHDNEYIKINGRASTNPKDRLEVELNSMSIENLLDVINFHSVEFGGKASGHASVSNLYGKPDFNANLHVDDFRLMGGHLGNADITAFWNDEKNGIGVQGYFVDMYKVQNGLNNGNIDITGTTTVDGYISPADNYINLGVNAQNTSLDFLNGILYDVFTEIDGRVDGHVNVVGDLDDINIIGDVKASSVFRLAATNVPYYIDNQPVQLKFHEFEITDIKLLDAYNNAGILNGKLTHDNLARFTYTFDLDMTHLLAYNESEFNADKYKATVYADGNLTIMGSDGHPLYIDATVSPAKGSVFAYDAATPDAISSNSFIEFRDVTPKQNQRTPMNNLFTFTAPDTLPAVKAAVEEVKYKGDVYVNFIINLNPNCEVKLRMDNTEDGYISTFGNANFQAKWHNKGAFQLFGNYNITSGKYRLYLQDIVYRNLDIKEGSSVEFNGNPFEADVHLICHHEIQSVPLTDLTGTRAFSSNNKVKVICKLDITGHIDNMNLAFDFELPNSNEEVRQLVKSMVTSEEEMNNQMIYLLGFQRFYPNEFARANNENASTSAVNSLISSTISGQINQMLSNMLGRDSKWNFGTGISTGENGWEDLDVEGILSGRLFNDRLLINGNFGYRDNALTNQANFIGDFEVKYRIFENGDLYVKAYNMTNDRYFTKATLNTQGIGVSFQHSFDKFNFFKKKHTFEPVDTTIIHKTDTITSPMSKNVDK